MTNPEEHFSVDPLSGVVRINKPLDYETTQKYELSVYATDNGSEPMKASARIEVHHHVVEDFRHQ
jgi:protocadherin-16/23